jgi:hypothetical protein
VLVSLKLASAEMPAPIMVATEPVNQMTTLTTAGIDESGSNTPHSSSTEEDVVLEDYNPSSAVPATAKTRISVYKSNTASEVCSSDGGVGDVQGREGGRGEKLGESLGTALKGVRGLTRVDTGRNGIAITVCR